MERNKSQYGFTLVEMLVVLVITALTASIMVTGLETTWRNFTKLDSKFLSSNSAQLPKLWFIQSVEASLLRQHTKVSFSGNETSFRHITSNIPSEEATGIHQCDWSLVPVEAKTSLRFKCAGSDQLEVVVIDEQLSFSYLTNGGWVNQFENRKGELPLAVKILSDTQEWVVASPLHPQFADVPAEIPTSGQYEF